MDNRNPKRSGRVGRKQNKEKRDASKAKELTDLKRQNDQLKRQVSRLAKELTKREEIEIERVEVEDPLADEMSCGKCGDHPLSQVELFNKTLTVCKKCGHREVKEKI